MSAGMIERGSVQEGGGVSEPLVRKRRLGAFTLYALDGGRQRLDGGAMFGVVPKPLWEKRIAADARNRIPLALRCLLLETPDALVLVDTGAGNKDATKFRDIYGIENASVTGQASQLEDALAAAGYEPADVDVVIDSHLHFDHAGGNTRLTADGQVALSFPRAKYVAQQGEFDYAHWHNERVQASYLPDNFDPVQRAGRLQLVEGEVEVVPGIRVLPTPGHTPHHTSIVVRSEDETACFLADLVPTAAHLPLAWIMGYDVEPLVTLETKRRLLRQAREENWLLVFEHDPAVAWGRLHAEPDRPQLAVLNEQA